MKGIIFLKYLLMYLPFEVNFSSSSLPTTLNTGNTVSNASSWRISIWYREVSHSQKGPSKKEGVKVGANSRMVFLVFWNLKRNQLPGDFQLYPTWCSQWGWNGSVLFVKEKSHCGTEKSSSAFMHHGMEPMGNVKFSDLLTWLRTPCEPVPV